MGSCLDRAIRTLIICLMLYGMVHPGLITPYGKEKAYTVLNLNLKYVGQDKYNITAYLYNASIWITEGKEEKISGVEGSFANPSLYLTPLKGKTIKFSIDEASCTTERDGGCTVEVDLNNINLDSTGCAEVYAEFEGDKYNENSKSRTDKICKSSLISIMPAIEKTVKEVYKNEEYTNTCIVFFILIGFLIAGLYASGHDPLRLLDITTPRLPAARRKPEIHIQLSEDTLRRMRQECDNMKKQVDGIIESTAKAIANASALRYENEVVKRIASENKIDEQAARNLHKAEIKQAVDNRKKELFKDIIKDLVKIKEEFMRKIKVATAGLPTLRAILVERDLLNEMYIEIGNKLITHCRNKAPEILDEVKKTNKMLNKVSSRYTQMLHHTNLISLRERGPYRGMGTISEPRKFVEKLPVVGYSVRVIDNMIGFVGRMPYYRIKSAIERGSKIRTLERELRTLKSEHEELKKELESKLNEREISEEDRKEIEKRHAELIKKEAELIKKEAELNSEKERGHVLPDPVKDASEPVMYATNLAKEIANAANHLLLNEIKRNVSEEEFDKLYGEIVYERDPFKRYLTIKRYVKENKIHINDEINKNAEEIMSKVIKNLKELDDFVGTREEIDDQIKAVDKLVAKAREIVGDPVKYGLLIVDQDDQLRRYIELSDFVDEEVLEECKNNGLEAGLKLLKSKNNIEDYKKIMETHAAFVKGGVRFRGRIEDIKKDMVWFMIRQREFKHLISVLENKGMLTGKMSQEKLEKLSRYFAREMSYIDSIEIETLKEREERTDKIKEITASALVQIGREEGRLGENVSKQDIIEEMNKIAGTTISNEDRVMISKEMENEEILIDAIKEWAHERAFDRATGITKLNGFEKDIIYLANKTESEINAYRLLIKRADDFNGQKKRNAIIVINERLGGIVKDVNTKKSEDILLEMDAQVREVLYNSLVEFYKKVSEEGETYREYFVKKTIGGKEHLLIKGHVDPTKKDVVKLVKMFNKEFPHKKRDLLKIVRDELVKRIVGKEDAEKIAPNYLGFYDELSSYAILHPGLDLPYDAANQFVWIYESKSVYKAVPEEMPPYETMGPADTLVNYGIVKRKVKHELRSGEEIEEEVSLLRPVTGKWQDRVRKVANWIEIQGNELLGAYIGVMSEEVATHVIYTRHGEFIRKLGEFHKGSGTFAEDVMRNPGLCNKLIELYKARVVLPRVNKLNEKDREKLMNVLNLDGIKKGIIEELKKIEDKARKDGKVSEADI
ncbi:MAG: hypothetical protein ACPL0A_00280, partial [Candidatus Micrarchaeia archaeon]